jgi:hypothetical protein
MTRKLAVVTTFSVAGFDQYAHRMIDTWLKHWPSDVTLFVYPDQPVPLPERPNLRVMAGAQPQKAKFIKRWKDKPECTGTPGGKPYDYRFDAIKFCHKPFCLWDFATRNDHLPQPYEGVIWLDADTITHRKVDQRALLEIAPPQFDMQSLGRSYKYTECGYLWFCLRPESKGRAVLEEWVRLYTSGDFRKQREWHDSYLFDMARPKVAGGRMNNLTGHIPRRSGGGHPFVNCFLGEYMDHHKGPRKITGKPRKNDLFADHAAPYWKDHPHAKTK